jgi:hypothetical protein
MRSKSEIRRCLARRAHENQRAISSLHAGQMILDHVNILNLVKSNSAGQLDARAGFADAIPSAHLSEKT